MNGRSPGLTRSEPLVPTGSLPGQLWTGVLRSRPGRSLPPWFLCRVRKDVFALGPSRVLPTPEACEVGSGLPPPPHPWSLAERSHGCICSLV